MASLELGLSLCFFGAGLYLFGHGSLRKAEELGSVTRVNQLKDLSQLLHDKSSLIVTFSGVVAADRLLKCKRSGLEGVVVEETVRDCFLEKHILLKKADATSTTQKHKERSEDTTSTPKKLKERSEDRCGRIYMCTSCKEVALDSPVKFECVCCGQQQVIKWVEGEKEVLSTRNQVPWYLDDGTERVRMVGVRLEPTVKKQGYEEVSSARALVEYAVGWLECGKTKIPLGIKWTDGVVPVGEFVTVVGEVYKDNGGTFCLRPSQNGPFHVATGSKIDEIIEALKRSGRCQKFISMGFAVAGFGMILSVKFKVSY